MQTIRSLNKPKNAIIFCYLCGVKTDYVYNISINFREAVQSKKWEKESLKINSYLTEYSNIHRIFKNLKNHGIILFSKEQKEKGKIQKYYKVNPEIFLNLKILEDNKLKKHLEEIRASHERFRNESSKDILINLFNKYYFQSSFSPLNVISELNKWNKFDFYTILNYNHHILAENLVQYSKSPKKEYKTGEKIDLKELTLIFLTNYFDIYKNQYILSYYREDFELFSE